MCWFILAKYLEDFRMYVCIVGYQLACHFLGWVVGHTGGFLLSGHYVLSAPSFDISLQRGKEGRKEEQTL